VPSFPVNPNRQTGSLPVVTSPQPAKPQETASAAAQPAPVTEPVAAPPGDTNTTRTAFPEAGFDPSAGFSMPRAAAPASPTAPAADPVDLSPLSQPLRVSYEDFKAQLKADPKVEFIEIDRRDLNKGLSDFLKQYQDLLTQNPELLQKLQESEIGRDLLAALDHAAKGALSTDDIIKLQTFAVASGVDISHANSANGIDGDYGPRTHAGLQEAFSKLLSSPDQALESLKTAAPQATTYAQTARRSYEETGDAYIPGQSRTYDAPPEPGSQPATPGVSDPVPTSSGQLGQDIAAAARRTASTFRNPKTGAIPSIGYCMGGVRTTLDSMGIRLRAPGGGYLQSAKDADDVLRRNFSDKFDEVKLSPNDPQFANKLRNFPPGTIFVWEANPDPSTHSRGGGFKHGHIEVALGGGKAASDHIQNVTTNANGRYGSVSIFVPKA